MTTLDLTRPATRVAFPVLTRVGGLPASDLDFVGERTRALLLEDAAAAVRLEVAGDGLIDVCFALVPQLEDDVALRRRVLAGKRAVHRAAALPWTEEEMVQILARLGPTEAESVVAYRAVCDERDRVREELSAHVIADRSATLELLARAVRHPGFAESIAIAAPDWVRFAKPTERPATSPKDIKTLLSYVARAAVKTSPFSGLTTVGVVGSVGRGRARSRITAVLGLQALELLARDEATAHLLRYQPCTLRPGGPNEPKGLVLASELVTAEGIVWRDDKVIEADNVLPWLDLLGDPGPAGLELPDVLARIGGAQPFLRFRRLLESGVLRTVAPWHRDEDPLAVLAGVIGSAPSPVSGAVLADLSALGDSAAGATAAERLTAAEAIGRATQNLTAGVQGHRPSGLVYEDRESDLTLLDPLARESVAEDFRLLADRVRPQVFRSHIYDLLLERFVAEFGQGGSSTDPLGFFMRQSIERDQDPALQRAQAADQIARRDPGERAWLPVGTTSAPPSVGVMFQLAESGTDRPQLVVNNFGSGSGALFARFSALLGEQFATDLRRGIRELWRDVPCRELTLWTDCNTAQAECSGLLPPLLVPGEPSAPDGLGIEDCVLVHDVADNTLSLTTKLGEPFGLAYLGLTPRHLLQGYLRFLGVLADPWINASPDSDYTITKFAELAPLCGDQVAHLPRATHGSLVTRRESWIVPRHLMPDPDQCSDDLELALRAHAFRSSHGMPEEVFVSQLGGMGAPMSGVRKPIWTSWASPTALRVMSQSLGASSTHLRIVEALPTRSAYPQRDRAGRPVVTEHCALLHWPATARDSS